MLTIPAPKAAAAPAAPRSEDVEALASSAFADEPPREAPVSTKTIEFECPFCAETVKISADLAGKQAPCPNPECKRIIKVPQLKEDKPRDWRQMNPRGPSGALRKDPNEPEGTWSTAQKTRVSQEALLEADAIPVKKQPMTVRSWIRLATTASILLALLIGGTVGWLMWAAHKRLWDPFYAAVTSVEPETKLQPPAAAWMHANIGEFWLLQSDAAKAKDHFAKAYARFPLKDDKTQPDVERDAAMLALQMLLIEYGGETETGSQMDWGTVRQELERSLRRMSSVEAQQTALREIAGRLPASKQEEITAKLLEQLHPLPLDEAAPQQQPDNEGDEPQPAKQPKQKRTDKGSPLLAQHIALLYLRGQSEKATQIAPEKAEDQIAVLGWAEAKARKGEFDAAWKVLEGAINPLYRLEASLAVAAIAKAANKPNEAKTAAEEALSAFRKLDRSTKLPGWQMIQLTRVCARNGMEKEAKQVIDAFGDKDKAARALAQLELLTAQLEKSSGAVPANLADDIVTAKDTLAYAMAITRIARRNTSQGMRSETLGLVDTQEEQNQPFVQISVALGQMDQRK
jgi:hypothetical protein